MTLNKQVSLSPTRSDFPGSDPPASVTQRPSYGQVVKDAFKQENTVVAAFDFLADVPPLDDAAPPDGFDAFEDIEGTIFEDFPEDLIGVRTQDEKEAKRIDREEWLARHERLESAGALGYVATFAAGMIDPLIMMPIGGQIKAANATIAAAKLTRGAKAAEIAKVAFTGTAPAEIAGPLTSGISTARAAMIGASASEAVLQAAQDTRSLDESVLNVTASMFLGGMLGAGVGQMSRSSRRAVLKQINDDLGSAHLRGGSGTSHEVKLTEADLVQPTDGSSSGAEIKLQKAFGFERWSAMKGARVAISPFVRIIGGSHSNTMKKSVMELVDSPVRTTGAVSGSSVEAEILSTDALVFRMVKERDRLYTTYRARIAKESGKGGALVAEGGRLRRNVINATDIVTQRRKGTVILSPSEFNREAGASFRSRDSGIPEANEFGKMLDETVYKPMVKDMTDLGMMPEEVLAMGPKGARNYLRRVYNVTKIIAEEDTFKSQKIRPWVRSIISDEEINAILKQADLQGKTSGTGGLEKRTFTTEQSAAIDRAVDNHVHSIFENITTSTRGRIQYEQMPSGKGSPFKERALTWEDSFIEEYLEQDIEVLTDQYIRTMAPDIAIMRKFGSLDLHEQLEQVGREYADARAAAKTPKERAKIQAQQADDIEQLKGMVGLLRGTYGVPPMNNLVTAGRVVRAINFSSMGGGFGINSIPDLGMIPMRNGLVRSFKSGYIPFIRNLDSTKLAREELNLFGSAVDLAVDTRAKLVADIGTEFAQNRVEEVAQNVSRNFSIVNMLAPWNSIIKGIAGNVSMTRMIDTIIAEGTGTATAKDIAKLEFARLGPDIRAKIRAELLHGGGMTEADGLKWSNTLDWTDLEARQEWGRAVRFTVDNTILTPGAGAAPLWLSTELGRTVFQFQRFGFGATNTILLAGLQTADMATLNALAIMTALGMSVEWIKNQQNDRQNPETLGGWVEAGIDRTGALGVYGTMFNMGKIIAGREGMSSRYAARNLTSTFTGPTLGTIESAAKIVVGGAQGFSDADMRTVRRLTPYNQVPYLQAVFDQLEDGVSEALSLPKKRKRKRRSN